MPIDVQIIPELKDALGAGFESIIYELNGITPEGGSMKKKSPQRKRKVKGGNASTEKIQGGSRKKSVSRKRRSVSRKRKSVRKSPSRKMHPIRVGPRTAMGYFLERNKQVVLGPYRTKQEAMKAKSRLFGIMNML
jgi:hypothetical protein